jgi:hypothetical protein
MSTNHVPNDHGHDTAAHYVARGLGLALVAIGLVGWVSPGLLGAHLSPAHNVIHLASGALSLYVGFGGSVSTACTFDVSFGIVYGLLGLAGFVAGTPAGSVVPGMPHEDGLLRVIPGILELGMMDHVLHVAIAAAYIMGALITTSRFPRRPMRDTIPVGSSRMH